MAAEISRRIIPVVHRPCELPDGFQFELAGVQRIDFATEPYDAPWTTWSIGSTRSTGRRRWRPSGTR